MEDLEEGDLSVKEEHEDKKKEEEKKGDGEINQISIAMKRRAGCCCIKPRRYFPKKMPPELKDTGLERKQYRKIIAKINRIWNPPFDACCWRCRSMCREIKKGSKDECLGMLWLAFVFTILSICTCGLAFALLLCFCEESKQGFRDKKVQATKDYLRRKVNPVTEELGMGFDFRTDGQRRLVVTIHAGE